MDKIPRLYFDGQSRALQGEQRDSLMDELVLSDTLSHRLVVSTALFIAELQHCFDQKDFGKIRRLTGLSQKELMDKQTFPQLRENHLKGIQSLNILNWKEIVDQANLEYKMFNLIKEKSPHIIQTESPRISRERGF